MTGIPKTELDAAAGELSAFICRHRGVTVLSGAGCSTESGSPDYRDDHGNWKHKKPMFYSTFVRDVTNRQRYWAQSFSGWKTICGARPNPAHHAIAQLEHRGYVSCVVTQNVDGLHQQAGSRNVIDLHGVLHRVRCLSCHGAESRREFQKRLRAANPDWNATVTELAPDGDARLSRPDFASFVVPGCVVCGGVLKPDVVFFGESVPKQTVRDVHHRIDASGGLLVVGSSLMVFSGLRFVRSASRAGKPIVILNRGTTRGDDLATQRLSGNCAEILSRAVELLPS